MFMFGNVYHALGIYHATYCPQVLVEIRNRNSTDVTVNHLILFDTLIGKSTTINMREIVHMQAGQCGNQIGAKVSNRLLLL